MENTEMVLGMFAVMSLLGMVIALTIAIRLAWQLEQLKSATNLSSDVGAVADPAQEDKADSQPEQLR